ncbi:alkaline phosphatase isozyme conversion protein [Klebsiella pneumoniae]|uniref:Alkaline phosphatase isozyme conversion protein n=1 Tax=Klebsiella pneumoniae TaxID=573 RepID=A0A3S4GJX4_KLEPN|nr:alkaline phosphatase isozyme conversion protein [Klebsiella pneumoniae]
MAISSGANRASFPQGTSWHDVQLDNQQYIDHALPGRIEHRGREVVKVMLRW